MRGWGILRWGLCFVLLCLGLGCQAPSKTPVGKELAHKVPEPNKTPGFVFELSSAPPPKQPKWAPTSPLTPAQTQTLLARIAEPLPPPLPPAKKRPDPRPRPTGTHLFPDFSEEATPQQETTKTLSIERIQPEGQEPPLDRISITFNKTMVSLGQEGTIPATLEPEPPGQWRWLGTRTLVFEPKGGVFPKSSTFQLKVPADTASLDGTSLGTDLSKTFETPRNQITQASATRFYPYLSVEFSQAIDPKSVASLVSLKDSETEIPLTLVPPLEAKEHLPEGSTERVVLFETDRPMAVEWREDEEEPYLDLAIKAGLGSEEGPLRTTESIHKDVYPLTHNRALKLEDTSRPGETASFQFLNELDHESWEQSWVSVNPEVRGLKSQTSSNYLYLAGDFRGNTTYTVTVSEKARDRFGQELGQAAVLTLVMLEPEPELIGPAQEFVVLSNSESSLPFFVSGVKSLDVRAHSFELNELDSYFSRNSGGHWYAGDSKTWPGKEIWRKDVATKGGGEIINLDLTEPLSNAKLGILLIVEAEDCDPYITLVEQTDIGISTLANDQECLVWVNHMTEGTQLADVDIKIGEATAKSAQDGVARLTLKEGVHPLIASSGDDQALMPSQWFGSFLGSKPELKNRWSVFTDRGLYRPGEVFYSSPKTSS